MGYGKLSRMILDKWNNVMAAQLGGGFSTCIPTYLGSRYAKVVNVVRFCMDVLFCLPYFSVS